jgi:hypothetical protein
VKAQSAPGATMSRAATAQKATIDLAAYQALEDDHLAALPGVQRITSTLVMKQIVNDRPVPL